eukprot:1509314-Rhodomonas_salina.4
MSGTGCAADATYPIGDVRYRPRFLSDSSLCFSVSLVQLIACMTRLLVESSIEPRKNVEANSRSEVSDRAIKDLRLQCCSKVHAACGVLNWISRCARVLRDAQCWDRDAASMCAVLKRGMLVPGTQPVVLDSGMRVPGPQPDVLKSGILVPGTQPEAKPPVHADGTCGRRPGSLCDVQYWHSVCWPVLLCDVRYGHGVGWPVLLCDFRYRHSTGIA